MPTILLIEDDEALGRQVCEHLRQRSFEVVWWKKGRRTSDRDLADVVLVILDLMLPGLPGLEILKHVREVSDVPVLVLSARQDSHDKTRALKLGADDYVTKPFWPDELVERVHARLRRPLLQRSPELTIDALVIHTDKRMATFDGRALDLTRVEFDLLLELARRPDQPVSRRWLVSNVLDPEREASERTLDVHVLRLRKKLGDPDVIETVWGIGYRLRRRGAA